MIWLEGVERALTVWPSLVRSTEGWFGGRTSLVVPITGHDILEKRSGDELCAVKFW
jgi:hypothetical protein